MGDEEESDQAYTAGTARADVASSSSAELYCDPLCPTDNGQRHAKITAKHVRILEY